MENRVASPTNLSDPSLIELAKALDISADKDDIRQLETPESANADLFASGSEKLASETGPGKSASSAAVTTDNSGLLFDHEDDHVSSHQDEAQLLREEDEEGDLQQRIPAYRATLATAQTYGTVVDATVFLDLAQALFSMFQESQAVPELDEAIHNYEKALDLSWVDGRAAAYSSLGVAYQQRFDHVQNPADVDRAVLALEEAVKLRSASDDLRAQSLTSLAITLVIRAGMSDADDGDRDRDEGIRLLEEVLVLCPVGHEDRLKAIESLLFCLKSRIGRFRRPQDTERLVDLYQAGLDCTPPGNEGRRAWLLNLGEALFIFGGHSDLERSIELLSEAAPLFLSTDPDRARCLLQLTSALVSRSPNVDDHSSRLCQETLHLLPLNHPSRHVAISNLGHACLARYSRTRDPGSLHHAIELHRQALALRPRGHPRRMESVNVLSFALSRAYDLSGDAAILDESVDCCRKALELGGPAMRVNFLRNLSHTLRIRYDKRKEPMDLNEVIKILEELLILCPLGHADRTFLVSKLIGDLRRRLGLLPNVSDIDHAVRLHKELIASTPEGDEERPELLDSLAMIYRDRHELSQELGDLDCVIANFQEALALTPPSNAQHGGRLLALGSARYTHFQTSGQVSQVDEALRLFEGVLQLCPTDSPDYARALARLGVVSDVRFEFTADVQSLDQGISFHRSALELRPEGHVDRHSSLHDLGYAYRARFTQLGDLTDLEKSLGFTRQALDLRHAGHPTRHHSLNNLSTALLHRYERLGGTHDLQDAISFGRDALRICPTNHADRADALATLGNAIFRRFQEFGGADDIAEAIALHEEAVSLHPSGSPNRPVFLNNLACALEGSFVQLGDTSHLARATKINRDVLALRLAGSPQRFVSLINLASCLKSSYYISGNVSELEESGTLCRQALQISVEGQQNRDIALAELGEVLRDHSTVSSDPDELEEAIKLQRLTLTLHPPGHPARPRTLAALGLALDRRCHMSGRAEDFEDMVRLFRESLELLPEKHRARAHVLSNFASALSTRTTQEGNRVDREEGIDMYREALRLMPPGNWIRYWTLNNLGSALCGRFQGDTQDVRDINEALVCHTAALELLSQGNPNRFWTLTNKASALHGRFNISQDAVDLEDAIKLHGAALALTPEGHPERHQSLLGLASALSSRFQLSEVPSDAITALEFLQEVAEILPPGHAYRAHCLTGICKLYLFKNAPYYDPCAALEALNDATRDSARNAQLRFLDAAGILATLSAHAPASSLLFREKLGPLILEAYRLAIGLLPRVAYFGLDFDSRLQALDKSQDVANEGSVYALLLGQPMTALGMLEEGRAVFWNQALRLRMGFEGLPPQLARELAHTALQLEMESQAPLSQSDSAARMRRSLEEDSARRRRISARFNNLIDEVRRLPGQERFMLNESPELLVRAANNGPVVVLLSNRESCHAIVIKSPAHAIQHVPLRRLTAPVLKHLGSLLARANVSTRAVAEEHRLGVQKVMSDEEKAARVRDRVGSREVLQVLWHLVVHPIIMALDLKKAAGRERPRLWWIPTGPMLFLPIHAAGDYDDGGDCCSDFVVSSYAPTLGSLLSSRQQFQPLKRSEAKSLLAAVPRGFVGQLLPSVELEVSALKEVIPRDLVIPLPAEDDCSATPDGGATVRSVMDNLSEASILHMASHGHQASKPLQSGFIMRDQRLTVAKLMTLKLTRAFMAFLSACETAKGDQDQPDQTIHLAAVMLFVGFRTVVGTMWPMGDDDGPTVAKIVYRALFEGNSEYLDPDSIPYALDDAVRGLRYSGLPPSRWATYIHIGM